jgi:hypothetical protein
MRRCAGAILGGLMLLGGSVASVSAQTGPGVSFGFGGPNFVFGDPCDYYDYYDQPPPWGLPPDYCEYPVYFEPVYVDGIWYRGPIYYRWNHGRRLFWLHGGWREDGWRGPRPSAIVWQERGGFRHGFRPGAPFRGVPPPWRGGGRPWPGGHH